MSIAHIARPGIRAMKPYAAAEQIQETVRLNANEAPWHSPLDNFRRPLNRYPEIRPTAVRGALAGHYGVDVSQLAVTRGSSEAIDLLIRIFCREGQDNIVTIVPGFSMYRHYALVQGADVREVRSDPDENFAVAASDVLAACDQNSRIVFLCSPNNPTGTILSQETLVAILDARMNTSAVVLDEAYIEFSGEHSAIRLLEEYPNLIVLRTLSKAFAAAGARCGVALGDRAIIDMLDAVQAPYAIATPVVEWVEDALQADALAEAATHVAGICAERERLLGRLQQFAFIEHIWPSAANFLLVRLCNVQDVLTQSREDRVLLRHFGGELNNCLRITVGSREENERLLQSFARVGG
ncbi:MAG TPA: histidinol-phosphate transaminase [Woeseiaceae bacterium]|nr:histidinol-phosphate transaminase [Woeseiaceae bacterium]